MFKPLLRTPNFLHWFGLNSEAVLAQTTVDDTLRLMQHLYHQPKCAVILGARRETAAALREIAIASNLAVFTIGALTIRIEFGGP